MGLTGASALSVAASLIGVFPSSSALEPCRGDTVTRPRFDASAARGGGKPWGGFLHAASDVR